MSQEAPAVVTEENKVSPEWLKDFVKETAGDVYAEKMKDNTALGKELLNDTRATRAKMHMLEARETYARESLTSSTAPTIRAASPSVEPSA